MNVERFRGGRQDGTSRQVDHPLSEDITWRYPLEGIEETYHLEHDADGPIYVANTRNAIDCRG